MSNSSLVTYTKISPNKTSPRNHAIDTITIHCYVGQVTAKQGCDYLAGKNVGASANYVVGRDGSIGQGVDEADRSWCSSSGSNDHRAVTIEVASDTTEPYAVTTAAYNALIELVADICKRNGIKRLVWSTNKNDRVNHVNGCNMTVHRDFAQKSCPGEYLYSRHGDIAAKVNAKLSASATTSTTSNTTVSNPVATTTVAGFNDIPVGAYYIDAIKWAAANGIATGTDAIHFSPDVPCTRGQAVTFLWRAAGKPEPTLASTPFDDVVASDYYYKPVLWAVSKGITTGVDNCKFAPGEPCSRGQVVTFLYRYAGKPAVNATNKFVDVTADKFYANAVEWAVKEGITSGVDATHFAPDDPCTRAQMVTFLYRMLG